MSGLSWLLTICPPERGVRVSHAVGVRFVATVPSVQAKVREARSRRLLRRVRRALARWVTPARLLLVGVVVTTGFGAPTVVTVTNGPERWWALPDGLDAEEVVVGLELDAGRVPSGLTAGASVGVLETGTRDAGRLLAARATVEQATLVEDTDTVRVELRVPAESALPVASAGAEGRVALVVQPMM